MQSQKSADSSLAAAVENEMCLAREKVEQKQQLLGQLDVLQRERDEAVHRLTDMTGKRDSVVTTLSNLQTKLRVWDDKRKEEDMRKSEAKAAAQDDLEQATKELRNQLLLEKKRVDETIAIWKKDHERHQVNPDISEKGRY